MTLQVAVPGREFAIKVPVYNATTAAAISSGEVVKLATGSTPNLYAVTRVATAASSCVRLFGVVEEAIATGQVGYCTIHGPAKAMAAAAITVKAPLTAHAGTTGVRGRVEVATAASTAGLADNGTYLGWAMSVGSTGAFCAVFVNTAHTPVD